MRYLRLTYTVLKLLVVFFEVVYDVGKHSELSLLLQAALLGRLSVL